ncbi:MAG: iron-sulfur cluster assembly accessory protein [Chromatiales bacterium]|nr:iron-sulfur cluster assembly accessory protein [Chromatiales bacterium]
MIEVTPEAAEQIRAALADAEEEGLALRVAARRGDDGELEYGLGFDERREQDEEIVTDTGITLLVSPPSRQAMAGMVLDFVEIDPGQKRFIFYRAGERPAGGRLRRRHGRLRLNPSPAGRPGARTTRTRRP